MLHHARLYLRPAELQTVCEHLTKEGIEPGLWSRRYEPFIVAETEVSTPRPSAQPESDANPSGANGKRPAGATDGLAPVQSSGDTAVNPAAGGNGAFNALADYIFGGNAARERMAMTTPVFTDSGGSMQFVVRTSDDVRACAERLRPSRLTCAVCMLDWLLATATWIG